jgi:hypothetical protein
VLLVLGLLLSLWFLPYRVPASDEGALLTQAARILRGDVYYQDLDAYPFPLAPYFLAGVMSVMGEHVSVARGVGVGVFLGILTSVYAIALPLLGRARAALLAFSLLTLKFIAWPSLTAFFYWDLSFGAACWAIALLLRHDFEGPTRALLAAGVATGVALAAKQTPGIYLALATFALLALPGGWLGLSRAERGELRVRVRECVVFGAGIAIPLIPMFIYFAYQGVLFDMLYSGLIRPFTGYLSSSGISFWVPLHWWNFGTLERFNALPYFPEPYLQLVFRGWLPDGFVARHAWTLGELYARILYTSLPIAFAWGFGVWVRATARGERVRDRALFAFGPLAGAVVFSAFPRADFPHIISVYPLVIVLLFALWGRVASEKWARCIRVAECAGVAAILLISGWLAQIQHAHLTYRMEVARASLLIAPEESWVEAAVEYLEETVAPDERLLVVGHEAHYYFLVDRYYPWPFVQLYPGQAGGDEGLALARLLESDPPKRIVKGTLRFKGIPYLPDYAPHLIARIRDDYEIDPEVFTRKAPAEGSPPRGRRFRVMRPKTR